MSKTLHYKTAKNEIALPHPEGNELFDPTGVLTEEQLTAVKRGERVTFEVDGHSIEIWIGPDGER